MLKRERFFDILKIEEKLRMSKKEPKPMHVKYEALSDVKFNEAVGIPGVLYELLVICFAEKRIEVHKKAEESQICVSEVNY